MAHYALLDNANIVQKVITGVSETDTDNLPEEFASWELFYANECKFPKCKRTSYNTHANAHSDGGTPFRGNFATIGYTWDSENQIFWPPKPYPSWVKNIAEARWQSPIGDHPNFKSITSPEDIWPDNVDNSEMLTPNGDGNSYEWNETTLSWDIA